MKKTLSIFALIIAIFLIFSGFGVQACERAVFKDDNLKYKVKIPNEWGGGEVFTNSRYFFGPNITGFSVERKELDQEEKESWRENRVQFARNFAKDYKKDAENVHNSIRIMNVKKYKKARNKKAVIIKYSGYTKYNEYDKPYDYRINQIIIKKKGYLYIISGQASKKQFQKARINYFRPAFKSFRILAAQL